MLCISACGVNTAVKLAAAPCLCAKAVAEPAPPALPVLSSMNPNTAVAGSADQLVHFIGTDFTPAAVVTFGGVNLATTYVSPTEVTAIIPSSTAIAGSTTVVVTTEGGTSAPNSFVFT